MKKLLLSTAIFFSLSTTVQAQLTTVNGVDVLLDCYSQKISPDGNVIAGQNPNGDLFSFVRSTNTLEDYTDAEGGNGNCISLAGDIVGQIYDDATFDYYCAVMRNGKSTIIPTLRQYGWGSLHGITPDGSRACGIITNPDMTGNVMDPSFNSFMYIPFYCDIDEEGNFSDPHWLPVTPKDFFGATPMECSAVWISDDGKTIAGQVVSNNGMYRYPIVYKENGNGVWEYSLPSEKLFNPDGDVLPEYPLFDKMPPSPTEFMSSEEDIKSFEAAYEFWVNNDYDPDIDPYDNLDIWMTREEIDAYEQAKETYNEEAEEYETLLALYYVKMEKVIRNSVFFLQNAMTLSPDGNLLASSHNIPVTIQGYLPVENFQPYIFNLSDGTWKVCGTEEDRLLTNQIFNNGILVCATPMPNLYSPDMTPVHSSLFFPETDGFVSAEAFIRSMSTGNADWMQEYLFKHYPVAINANGNYDYKDLVVSGKVSFSSDFSVMTAGVDGYSSTDGVFAAPLDCYFSYIFSNMQYSAVKKVNSDENGLYRVYNLQGGKVMETSDKAALGSLTKGIYVVNGKKIAI